MSYKLETTTPPAAEPLSLSAVKAHVRVDHDDDDSVLTDLIALARTICEDYTGRALITRSYSLWLDVWPQTSKALAWWDGARDGVWPVDMQRAFSLPMPPLAAVASIEIYAADDSNAAFDSGNYHADTAATPGRIVLAEGATPPLPGRRVNGIEVRYTAGYGATGADVPSPLKQGMLQLIAHFYDHRGDDYTAALRASGAAALFQPYRVAGL
ncbi:MAG: head-tail connector protein [Alphaproteobacteria bacterium]|nr:head-tail connector protein [Alphaproteobacteria bacterium]